jgi:Protein of unknown function (DUF2807).
MKTSKLQIGKLLLLLSAIGIGTNLQAQQIPMRVNMGDLKKINVVDYVERINVSGGADVVLSQSDSTAVYYDFDVKSGHENCNFDFKDSCIFINKTNKGLGKSGKSVIYVTMPHVKSIKVSSASDVASEGKIVSDELALYASDASGIKLDLDVKSLYVDAVGASDVVLSGKCGILLANSSGASDLELTDLSSRIAMVNSTEASDANIGSSDNVFYAKSGASNVTIIGDGKDVLSHSIISMKKLGGDNYEIIINDRPLKFYFEQDSLSGDTLLMTDIDLSELFFARSKDESNDSENMIDLDFDDEDSESFDSDYSGKSSASFHGVDANWAGVETGLNMLLNKDFNNIFEGNEAYLELNQGRSWCFNWNIVDYGLSIGRHSSWTIFTGIGLSWYNFKFATPTYLTKMDGALHGYFIKGGSVSKTKLTTFYVQVPLMIEWAPSDFFISAGVTGGIRLSSHTKTVVDGNASDFIFQNMNGDMVQIENNFTDGKIKSFGDFYQNLFKLDASLRVGYGKLSVFSSYALMPLFVDGKGPEVYPFTFGLSLNF